jgi:hypothetical protein
MNYMLMGGGGGCATYHWKTFDKGYIFVLNLNLIGGLKKRYRSPKWRESQFQEFQDS